MSEDTYRKCMFYLDMIEIELNKIAKAVGHDDLDTWLSKQKNSVYKSHIKIK